MYKDKNAVYNLEFPRFLGISYLYIKKCYIMKKSEL